ncbi:MAG: type II secretion system F family protein [Actinomycetota bacterium]
MSLVLLVTIPLLVLVRRRRRRARQRQRAAARLLPDSVDIIVAALRAGSTSIDSLHLAARHSPEEIRSAFVACVRTYDDGARFHEALDELPRHLGPHSWPVVDLLKDHSRLGIPAVDTAEQLTVEARAARRRAIESSARELPVRLAIPLVVCSLPSFVLIVIAPVIIGAFNRISLG